MQKFWIIGNWKMYFSFNQACTWLKTYGSSLDSLSHPSVQLTICPSFDALSHAQKCLQNSSLRWGAQNCSAALSGAYTGQVSAQSLIELGCQLCLVGHSEIRALYSESQEILHKKLSTLISIGITPVLCIGETAEERSQGAALEILTNQLSVLNGLPQSKTIVPIIAYEPRWAIGTGNIPSTKELQEIIVNIKTELQERHQVSQPTLLYGGSVSEAHLQDLYSIKHLNGFLIGKASTNFQELKNIVVLIRKHLDI